MDLFDTTPTPEEKPKRKLPFISIEPETAEERLATLTPSEAKILFWKLKLVSNPKIQKRLSYSEAFVTKYISQIYKKLLEELPAEWRKEKGHEFLEIHYSGLVNEYLPSDKELNNWPEIQITIKRKVRDRMTEVEEVKERIFTLEEWGKELDQRQAYLDEYACILQNKEKELMQYEAALKALQYTLPPTPPPPEIKPNTTTGSVIPPDD